MFGAELAPLRGCVWIATWPLLARMLLAVEFFAFRAEIAGRLMRASLRSALFAGFHGHGIMTSADIPRCTGHHTWNPSFYLGLRMRDALSHRGGGLARTDLVALCRIARHTLPLA